MRVRCELEAGDRPCGLRAERTSLLSLGDQECGFAVLETDDPLAAYADTLERRFIDKQETG